MRYIDGGPAYVDFDAPVPSDTKRTYEFRSRVPTSPFL